MVSKVTSKWMVWSDISSLLCRGAVSRGQKMGFFIITEPMPKRKRDCLKGQGALREGALAFAGGGEIPLPVEDKVIQILGRRGYRW